MKKGTNHVKIWNNKFGAGRASKKAPEHPSNIKKHGTVPSVSAPLLPPLLCLLLLRLFLLLIITISSSILIMIESICDIFNDRSWLFLDETALNYYILFVTILVKWLSL